MAWLVDEDAEKEQRGEWQGAGFGEEPAGNAHGGDEEIPLRTTYPPAVQEPEEEEGDEEQECVVTHAGSVEHQTREEGQSSCEKQPFLVFLFRKEQRADPYSRTQRGNAYPK